MSLVFAISILTFLIVMACSAEYMDQRGREFLLGFPLWPNASQSGSVRLHVRGPKYTNLTIELVGSGEINNYTIGLSENLTIHLPTNVEYNGSETPHNNSVRVLSTAEVYVYVIRGVSGAYFAVPKLSHWSNIFYVVSHSPSDGGYSYFSIIGYEEANVEIIFRTELNCGSLFITPYVPIRVKILPMQMWSIYCSQDLTGTYIKSPKPISVLSGTTFPEDPYGGKFVEGMLLPKAFFGSNFVLPTISGDTAVLRIVASENDTAIYAEGGLYCYMGAGDYVDVVTDDEDVHCLKGTRPIQVVLLGKRANGSSHSVDGFQGELVMAAVPPVERFQNHDKIDIFSVAGDGLISQVMFFFENDTDIEIGGTASSFFEYSECCNHVISYLVDSQQTMLVMPKNFSVGVMQLATTGSKGFGLTMGWSFDSPFCPRGSGFTYLNTSGLCIKAFTKPATWMEARTLCWDQRLRLVALDTQAKVDSIKQSLNDKLSEHSFSIGLHAFSVLFDINAYKWIDGGSLGNAQDWLPQQPHNFSSCVRLTTKNTKVGWESVLCDVTSGYVCEMVLAQTQDVQLFSGECQYSHPGCPTADGYTYIYEAELCVKLHPRPKTWINAAAACHADGDRLVTVDSDSKQLYLHRVYRHISPKYFIGSFWPNLTTGQWVWTNCSPLTYTNWDAGQPQDNDGHCVLTFPSGFWHDVQCGEVMPFICERSLSTTDDDGICEELSSLFSSSMLLTTSLLQSSSSSVLVSESSPSLQTTLPPHSGDSNVVSTETGGSSTSEIDLISSVGLSFADTLSSTFSTDTLVTSQTTGASYGDTVSLTPSNDMSSTTNLDVIPSRNSSEVSETFMESSFYASGKDIMPSTTFSFLESHETSVSHKSTASQDNLGLNESSGSNLSSDSSTLDSPMSRLETDPESSSIISNTSQEMQADISSVNGSETGVTESMETQSVHHSSSYTDEPSAFTESLTYTTTLIPDSNPERVVYQICRCSCIPGNRLDDLLTHSVDAKKKAIRENLLLDKRNLTKTIIKYTSATDDRTSSTSIGASGLALIVFTVLLILSSDVLTFFKNRPYERQKLQE
ncbi:uncharacterized protein [Haliotis cracherodii]|uniref:uncharacterized protein n=1 Tax=Haliotis cracherodii TaxID=6455 RepID=UPI0039EAA371